ncbi:Ras-related protein RABA1b [Nosema granulosis]|uniref:Ras-related protein RABA1b n=1 Tax=Nosema granulosis TaxID=83296 RepID=A0A9P6L0M9_9MICR|nr:Ras-related protein RABA1b [Nosema granulosis]
MEYEPSKHFDYLFKIVLIGDSAVGKTNILSQLMYKKYIKNSRATIGVEFGTMNFKIDDKVIKAQIWDTAGQERYRAITHAYYRGSYGAILVYDITNKDSLDKALNLWLVQLKNYADPEIPVILVGNKKDLKEEREVDSTTAENEAVRNNLMFFETSAKTGENVKEAFYELVKTIYQRQSAREMIDGKKKVDKREYDGREVKNLKPKKKSGCC